MPTDPTIGGITITGLSPLAIIELLLKIVLLAMEGQTPEQRAKIWEWYIKDVEWWRKKLGID